MALLIITSYDRTGRERPGILENKGDGLDGSTTGKYDKQLCMSLGGGEEEVVMVRVDWRDIGRHRSMHRHTLPAAAESLQSPRDLTLGF